MFLKTESEKQNTSSWYIAITSMLVTAAAGILQVFLTGTVRNILLVILFTGAVVVLVSVVVLMREKRKVPDDVVEFNYVPGALYSARNLRYVAIPSDSFNQVLDHFLEDQCVGKNGLREIGKEIGKDLGEYLK